jgi:Secretion system C-terminal sorting domain
MTQRLLFLLALCFSNQCVHAQDRCFSYDEAGNRTARISCILPPIELVSNPNQVAPPVIELEEGKVLPTPNPSFGYFILRTDAYPPQAEISIYNSEAQLVQTRLLGDGYIDLSAQPSGMYFVNLTAPNMRPRTVKVQILKD